MKYEFKVKFSEHIFDDSIGQLICIDAVLARDGSYQYSRDEVFGDGSYQAVTLHRDWEEVKKLIPSLEGKPVIYHHTEDGVDIDLDNIMDYKAGHAQNIRASKAEGYNVIIGDLFISDKDLIKKIKSGEVREISLGYFYTIDDSDKNKIKQVDMVAEHIALVESGRAGIAKILDAGDVFYLITFDKAKKPNYAVFKDDIDNQDGWVPVGTYGSIRYHSYQGDLLSASLIPGKMINYIISETNPIAVVINTNGKIVRAYNRGKKVEPDRLEDWGYKVKDLEDAVLTNEPIGDYEIPDEMKEEVIDTNATPVEHNKVRAIYDILKPMSHKVWTELDKGYKGIAFTDMVYWVRRYRKVVEELLGIQLSDDEWDNDYAHVMRSIINYGDNQFKKGNNMAKDELWLPILVVTYNADETNIEWFSSLEEVGKRLKIKIDKELEVSDMIDIINDKEGVFAIAGPFPDVQTAYVSTAISDDNVMIDTYTNLEDLNRDLNDYFETFYEALSVISLKQGRYKKNAIVIV